MKQTLALIAIIIILFSPALSLSTTTDHIEYNINLNADGSATWKIIQATDVNSTTDSLEEFQQRILTLINAARNSTTRDMALDFASLEIKTDMHWETSSQTIQYIFRWENFSIHEGNKIVFGDALNGNFFYTFYGNGEIYVTYPPQYSISSASLHPDEQNNSTQTLHWYRTQDFPTTAEITLTENRTVNNLPLTTFVAAFSGAFGVAAVGFMLLNHRRQRRLNSIKVIEPATATLKETQTSEEKILQLLKQSGGSINQSEICTKLKFSRAKTSLILAEMEKNNQVRRDKKGKNKIVHISK
jgi:uncharacterized membrane protein